MTGDLTLRHAAFALAYGAKDGAVEAEDVDRLVTLAHELSASDDPLHRACISFATQYELHRHDPAALRAQGEALQQAVERANWPVPDRRLADG